MKGFRPPEEIRKSFPVVKNGRKHSGVSIHLKREIMSMIHTENGAIQYKCIHVLHNERENAFKFTCEGKPCFIKKKG